MGETLLYLLSNYFIMLKKVIETNYLAIKEKVLNSFVVNFFCFIVNFKILLLFVSEIIMVITMAVVLIIIVIIILSIIIIIIIIIILKTPPQSAFIKVFLVAGSSSLKDAGLLIVVQNTHLTPLVFFFWITPCSTNIWKIYISKYVHKLLVVKSLIPHPIFGSCLRLVT